MVKIRLARHGSKKKPYYHIVVADHRMRRDGRFIEEIGRFNPMARGKEPRLTLTQERVEHWIGLGAQPTVRVARLIKDAKAQADKPQEPRLTRQEIKRDQAANAEKALAKKRKEAAKAEAEAAKAAEAEAKAKAAEAAKTEAADAEKAEADKSE